MFFPLLIEVVKKIKIALENLSHLRNVIKLTLKGIEVLTMKVILGRRILLSILIILFFLYTRYTSIGVKMFLRKFWSFLCLFLMR